MQKTHLELKDFAEDVLEEMILEEERRPILRPQQKKIALKIPDFSESIKTVTRYLMRDFPLMLHRFPLLPIVGWQAINPIITVPAKNLEKHFSYVKRYSEFNYGVQMVTDVAWPAAFLVMYTIDVMNYCMHPGNRYLSNGLQVAFGFSENFNPMHNALTSHLGGDMPGLFMSYSAATLGIACAAVVSGAAHAAWPTINKWRMMEYQNCWQGKDNIELLKIAVESRDIRSSWIALTSLMNVYARAEKQDSNLAFQIKTIVGVWLTDKEKLSTLTRSYLQYRLWSNGLPQEQTPIPLQILFNLIVLPFTLLSQYFLWKIMIMKMVETGQFLKEKSQISFYEFIPQIGRFDELACPWDFVPYPASKSLKKCIETLFKNKNNFDDILKFLNKVPSRSAKNLEIDLSNLPWSTANYITWNVYLFELNSLLPIQLDSLKLSFAQKPLTVLTDRKAQAFYDFLSPRKINTLDLSNLPMGIVASKIILASLNRIQPQQLRLASTQMGADGVEMIANSNTSNYQLIDITNTNVNGAGIMGLLNAVQKNPNLTLRLGWNPVADSLTAIWQAIADTQIIDLELNGIDHSNVDYDVMNAAISSAKIVKLHTEDCGLDEFSLQSLQTGFANSTIQQWHIAGNNIKPLGYSAFCTNMTFDLFNVSNTQLNANGIAELAACNLKRLDISNNIMTAAGLVEYFNSTTGMLEIFIANHCALEDSFIVSLLPLQNKLANLKALSLRENGFQTNISDILPKSLTQLDLSSNPLSTAGKSNLASWLAVSDCSSLNLNNVALIVNEMKFDVFKLVYLSLANNKLNDSFVFDLLNTIAPKNICADVLENNNNVDCNRALALAGTHATLKNVIVSNNLFTKQGLSQLGRAEALFDMSVQFENAATNQTLSPILILAACIQSRSIALLTASLIILNALLCVYSTEWINAESSRYRP